MLFEAQWKAFLATKETEKSAKKAAAPEEEVAPEESAAEEVTEVQTAAEAPAPEAEAVEAEAPPRRMWQNNQKYRRKIGKNAEFVTGKRVKLQLPQ